MSWITDLSEIFDMIHNTNSTATMPAEFEFNNDDQPDTLFDKYVLRWV